MNNLISEMNLISSFFNFSLSDGQIRCIDEYLKGKNLFLTGSAGVGKTWISSYLCYLAISSGKEVVLVNSKKSTYIILSEIISTISTDAITFTDQREKIKVLNEEEMSGKTYSNSLIYIDDVQELSKISLHKAITRTGENSTIIISGDYYQSLDGNTNKTHDFLEDIVSKMNSFSQINFYTGDIVRSEICREWCELAEVTLYS
jgi:phosphate starvation-inducible protein PhoH